MLELFGLEPERAPSVLEGDLALAVDQVKPARHGTVADANSIVDRVHEHRKTKRLARHNWLTAQSARLGDPCAPSIFDDMKETAPGRNGSRFRRRFRMPASRRQFARITDPNP